MFWDFYFFESQHTVFISFSKAAELLILITHKLYYKFDFFVSKYSEKRSALESEYLIKTVFYHGAIKKSIKLKNVEDKKYDVPIYFFNIVLLTNKNHLNCFDFQYIYTFWNGECSTIKRSPGICSQARGSMCIYYIIMVIYKTCYSADLKNIRLVSRVYIIKYGTHHVLDRVLPSG